MTRNFNKVFSSLKKIAKANLPAGTQVLLYGSRARGDANETSDWDVLIILDKDKLEKSDYDNVSFPFTALGWDLNERINPVLYTFKEWAASSFTPFYKNVKEEGVALT